MFRSVFCASNQSWSFGDGARASAQTHIWSPRPQSGNDADIVSPLPLFFLIELIHSLLPPILANIGFCADLASFDKGFGGGFSRNEPRSHTVQVWRTFFFCGFISSKSCPFCSFLQVINRQTRSLYLLQDSIIQLHLSLFSLMSLLLLSHPSPRLNPKHHSSSCEPHPPTIPLDKMPIFYQELCLLISGSHQYRHLSWFRLLFFYLEPLPLDLVDLKCLL